MIKSRLEKIKDGIKQLFCLVGALVGTVFVYSLFGYRIYESIRTDFSAWIFIILISLAAGGYVVINETKASIKESALNFISGFLGVFLVMAFLTGGNGCSMPKYYDNSDYDTETSDTCYDKQGPYKC